MKDIILKKVIVPIALVVVVLQIGLAVVQIHDIINIDNFRLVVTAQAVILFLFAVIVLPLGAYARLKSDQFQVAGKLRKGFEGCIWLVVLPAFLVFSVIGLGNLRDLRLLNSNIVCGFEIDYNRRGPDSYEVLAINEEGDEVVIKASEERYDYLLTEYGDLDDCAEISETLVYENMTRLLLEIR